MTGGSAGRHLSLLVGLTDAKSNLEGDGGNLDQSSRVPAVVNVFGPTDMTACHRTSSVVWRESLCKVSVKSLREANGQDLIARRIAEDV
jgi:hypothetical protein